MVSKSMVTIGLDLSIPCCYYNMFWYKYSDYMFWQFSNYMSRSVFFRLYVPVFVLPIICSSIIFFPIISSSILSLYIMFTVGQCALRFVQPEAARSRAVVASPPALRFVRQRRHESERWRVERGALNCMSKLIAVTRLVIMLANGRELKLLRDGGSVTVTAGQASRTNPPRFGALVCTEA